jgi:hypothetical protein
MITSLKMPKIDRRGFLHTNVLWVMCMFPFALIELVRWMINAHEEIRYRTNIQTLLVIYDILIRYLFQTQKRTTRRKKETTSSMMLLEVFYGRIP